MPIEIRRVRANHPRPEVGEVVRVDGHDKLYLVLGTSPREGHLRAYSFDEGREVALCFDHGCLRTLKAVLEVTE